MAPNKFPDNGAIASKVSAAKPVPAVKVISMFEKVFVSTLNTNEPVALDPLLKSTPESVQVTGDAKAGDMPSNAKEVIARILLYMTTPLR